MQGKYANQYRPVFIRWHKCFVCDPPMNIKAVRLRNFRSNPLYIIRFN